MPKYYYAVENIAAPVGRVGHDLLNDEEAWKQATVLAGEIFKDVDGKIRPGHDWSVDVFDEQGSPLFQIQISTKNK